LEVVGIILTYLGGKPNPFATLLFTMSFLQDYEICSQNNEAPKMYHVYSGLVALSSIVSGKVWLDCGLFQIRPNLYVILAGPAGGRKTTAMIIAKKLIRELKGAVPLSAENQTKEDLTLKMASYSRVCQLKEGEVLTNFAPLDKEKSKFLYCPISIFATEFSHFLGGSPAHMLDFLTNIYDEEIYAASTKNKGTDNIPMPYLTLLSCTVPDWITARLKDDVISGGFSRRAIFVYEERTKIRIAFPEVTEEMEQAWQRLIIHSKKLLNLKGEFKWGTGAKEFFKTWYDNLQPNEDPLMESWHSSIHIQMLKIAMLISASEWEEGTQHEICIDYMKVAIAMLTVVEANFSKVFKGVGRNELFGISNKIVELLDRSPDKQLPERFVKKELFREANIDEISKIILHLLAIRTITRVSGTLRPGAPAEVFLKLVPK